MQRDGVVSGYGRVDDAESVAMLRRAPDQGVNFLDTAPWYGNGHSERLVGEAIRGRREEVILCSKVGIALEDEELICNYSGDYIMAGYQDALERLGTDYIDVYVLHSPAVEEYDPSGLAALKELKRRGVIRAFGISFPASHQEGEQFYLPLCEREGVDVVQLRFNLVSWAARRTIMPALRALGIGIVCREPFFFGYLTGRFDRDTVFDSESDARSTWPRQRHLELVEAAERFEFVHESLQCSPAQAALCYCLSAPEVSTTLPGSMTTVELEENLHAARLVFDSESIHLIHETQEGALGDEL